MSNENNKRKDALLGEPHGTAAGRLRKLIIFDLAGRLGLLRCHRCASAIESPDSFSIEHVDSWQSAADPRASFFDMRNIAFSHLVCNVRASSGRGEHNKRKTLCVNGHSLDAANTLLRQDGHRDCRACNTNRMREERRRDPSYGRTA